MTGGQIATTNSHMRHDSVMMIYLNENCPLDCLASFMRQNVFPTGRGGIREQSTLKGLSLYWSHYCMQYCIVVNLDCNTSQMVPAMNVN